MAEVKKIQEEVKQREQIEVLNPIEKAKAARLAHLEAQSLEALTLAADNFERAVFPNAMIVGDCVITHLLGKLG